MYLWNFKAFMLFAACATGGFKTALAQLTKGDGTDNGIAPQKFLRQPADQTAIQGEHVTLPCRNVCVSALTLEKQTIVAIIRARYLVREEQKAKFLLNFNSKAD
ncbi:hypothetical protein TCAL_16557 [Tigriopus californicus]|uniref:Uncharacterized protein n=1 Tax=Tigriopus californicus TaxID=6832 RepID=A0A553NBN3_TIGCA|nr:hypothetical protein TCAL_16557 [Tigriopus californicus]